MGRALEHGLPCKLCGSSDATALYENGYHCFSCGESYDDEENGEEPVFDTTQTTDVIEESDWIKNWPYNDSPYKSAPERAISRSVMEYYGVKTNDKEFAFPFYKDNTLCGLKIKVKNPKKFYSYGKVNKVFGRNLWPGKYRKIVVTEGEFDALAVAQANYTHSNGKIYPTVSIGSSTNTDLLRQNRDWFRQMDEVVVWFDNDEPGQKATREAVKIIGQDKVTIVNTPEKDANSLLIKSGVKAVIDAVWSASMWTPASILQGKDTWEHYKSYKNMEFVPWPPFLEKLNEMTHGRARGTITMFGAGTGVGKSTFMKEDILHLLETVKDEKIGCLFLEEDPGETVSSLIGLKLNKRIRLPDVELTEEEERKAWEEVFGNNRIMLLNHQGSVNDNESIVNKIEYMCLSGCKFIFFDHITIAVSEIGGKDTNASIDKLMSDLLKTVKRHPVWIGVVSHLRKTPSASPKEGESGKSFEDGGVITEDDFKGSGSLKQISFQTIAISRKKMAKNDKEKHTSKLYLLKDRSTGSSGYAGSYIYNIETGRLKSGSKRDEEVDLGFGIEEFIEEFQSDLKNTNTEE